MKNSFHLTTECTFNTSADKIWQITVHVADYPTWWPNIKNVKLISPTNELELGAEAEYLISGFLPHQIQFKTIVTQFIPLSRIEMSVSGDLEGHGTSSIHFTNGQTYAMFEWNVAFTSKLLNALSSISLVYKLFEMNHRHAMNHAITEMKRRIEYD